MNIIDKKGDVTFYEDSKGNRYYQIYGDDRYKVFLGEMKYTRIESYKEYVIKFNTNCIDGFTIWKDGVIIDKGYWELHNAKEAVYEFDRSAHNN